MSKDLNPENILNLAKIIIYCYDNSEYKLYKTKLKNILFYIQLLYYKCYHEKYISNEFIKDSYGIIIENLNDCLLRLEMAEIIKIKDNSMGEYIECDVNIPNSDYLEKENFVFNKMFNLFDKLNIL